MYNGTLRPRWLLFPSFHSACERPRGPRCGPHSCFSRLIADQVVVVLVLAEELVVVLALRPRAVDLAHEEEHDGEHDREPDVINAERAAGALRLRERGRDAVREGRRRNPADCRSCTSAGVCSAFPM